MGSFTVFSKPTPEKGSVCAPDQDPDHDPDQDPDQDPSQVKGFFRGMAFPVLTSGLVNSLVFGAYSNALCVLSQRGRAERGAAPSVPALQVYSAGAFSGLVQENNIGSARGSGGGLTTGHSPGRGTVVRET